MENVQLEGVEIGYRNFSGRETEFNAKGSREFVTFLPEDVALDMQSLGWNIKSSTPREEGDAVRYYLPCFVRLDSEFRPAHVVMVTSNGRITMTDETISSLDYVEISNVDIIVRPYEWTHRNKTGVKAMVQSMYVTIVEDPLSLKYNSIPEVGQTPEVN